MSLSLTEVNRDNLFYAPKQSIWLSWGQFITGVALYVLSYYVFNGSVGDWDSSHFGSAVIAKAEVAIILLPLGLIGWQQPLFRFLSDTPFRTIVTCSCLIIAVYTVGGYYFHKWGVARWIDWDLDLEHPVRVVQGMYLALTLWLTGLTLICILIRAIFQRSVFDSEVASDDQELRLLNVDKPLMQSGIAELTNAEVKRRKLRDQVLEYSGMFLFFLVLIPLLMWVNCILTSDWHRLLPNTVDYELAKGWTHSDSWTKYYSYSCKYENDVDTVEDLTCYARLYYDIQIYFEFIFVVSLFSYVVMKFPRARLFVKRRVLLPTASFNPFDALPVSITIGEICFWLLWFAVMFTIGYYFVGVHNFDSDASKSTLEVWARYTGILAVQFLCFGIFAVTRVRLWQDCFQVSFEHLVGYHRFFGSCMILIAYLHGVLWMIFWGTSSSYSLSDNAPFTSTPFTYHGSNWTIPIMYQFMIVVVPICYGVCSFYMIRRQYFELFYYTHLFAAVITITLILWHATQSWRYIIAPLALYAVDRMIRMYNSSMLCTCELLTSNVGGDEVVMTDGCEAVKLSFKVATYSMKFKNASFGSLPFKMGQYCFVNISNIALYEWHPFTISSSEQSNEISFHIKNMDIGNNRCWTNLLYELAVAKTPTEEIDIHIDGPYGKPFEYDGYDRVVLVAGGIGITPCHSIFDTILNRAAQGDLVPYVNLIWVVRDASQATMFLRTWTKYESQSGLNRFNVRVFVTRADESNNSFQNVVPGTNIMYTVGRPPWGTVLSTLLTSDNVGKPESSLVFACGPAGLVTDVERVTVQSGAQFYSESFEF